MHLKKLQVLGFKSFADKTKLEFDEGITAIVGPNGCGKSNIADAFRWVLGEQSAKSMRGNKMHDVIFAGTIQRKPLNYAEVTITLTNHDKVLPIDYEEVAVTRRLHRSGESEYFLNGQTVRLKDLHNLFLDSGIGKNAFSIFEQGKIDQVINYSPLERRYIFEEASGILRFLQRKKEALRKLELADTNITRVKDIHQEVERQIIVLEEQAEKARLFKEHKVKLEALEKALFVAKWDQVQKKKAETNKKEEEQNHWLSEANQSMEALQEQLYNSKAELSNGEKALRTRSEEVFKTRSDKEIKSREKQTSQERLKESMAKEKRWQQELESLLEKREFRQTEQVSAQKQQKLISKELATLEVKLKAQKEKVYGADLHVGKLREQQQKANQELLKLMQAENQFESELKQNTVRLENTQERKEQIQESKDKLGSQIKDLLDQAKEKDRQVQEMSGTIDKQKVMFHTLEEKIAELSEQIQAAQREMELALQEINESKARQKALLRLREDLEGFSAGSKRLLKESQNPNSPLYAKLKGLYEWIVPEAGSENALAIVLRPYAQTLVVETKEDLQNVIAFAKKNKLTDFSLVCAEVLYQHGIKAKKEKKSG